MTSILHLEPGDITEAMRSVAKNPLVVKALSQLNIRLVLEQLPVEVFDAALDSFVRQPRYGNFYAVYLDGVRVQERLDMPRDVWYLLRGIAIGKGL